MSLSPIAIKEANEHIQGLVNRVHELEQQVRELSSTVKKQNEDHTQELAVLPLRMKQTMKMKDEQIEELKQQVAVLTQRENEREALVRHLRNRCKVLDELSRHRDTLESILSCLDVLEEPDYCKEQNHAADFTELRGNLTRETDLLDDNDLEESDSLEKAPRSPSKMFVVSDDQNVEPVHL